MIEVSKNILLNACTSCSKELDVTSNHSRPLETLALHELDLREDARPFVPPYVNVTEDQRHAGRHLATIHRMHLREISKARMVLRHVTDGTSDPAALIEALQNMEMTQNYRLFGNLCGQECRVLQFHHDAEEHHMFPELEAKGTDEIRCVIAKLREEHVVVHELLERLQKAALALISAPTEPLFTKTAEIFDKLEAVVRSHFGYEETELKDALGVHVGFI
jgi:hemerythrin superfamily protein